MANSELVERLKVMEAKVASLEAQLEEARHTGSAAMHGIMDILGNGFNHNDQQVQKMCMQYFRKAEIMMQCLDASDGDEDQFGIMAQAMMEAATNEHH